MSNGTNGLHTGNPLSGTASLIRLAVSRDKIRIPIWILSIVAFTVSFLPGFPELYPTRADRQSRAALMENPASIAMTGPGFGLDDYHFGAMVANEYLALTAVVVALMSVLLTVRHTRTEEEAGRAELLRAAAVGRHSAVAAAVSVVVGVNLLIAVLLSATMPLALDQLSLKGTVTYAASLAAVGIVFTGVGVLVAQFTFSTRGATGIGIATVGAAYVLRAVGDIGDGTLSWLSPIGWSQQTKSYVDNTWWPLLISAAATIILIAVAMRLSVRRDVGAGLVQPRAGAPHASAWLSGPVGLAWRLQRGTLLAWLLGMGLFGAVYGSVAYEIEDFAAGNEFLAETMAQQGVALTDSFFGIVVMLLALLSGGYAIQAVVRARGEETAMRAEAVLAAVVSRWRYLASHLLVALLGAPAVLLFAAVVMAATASASLGDWGILPRLVVAALPYIPVLWLLSGLGAALFGLLPRAMPLVWVVLAYAVIVGMLGAFLQVPGWAMNLSPFSHIPQAPAEGITVAPVASIAAIAAAALVAGLIGFRNRDLS